MKKHIKHIIAAVLLSMSCTALSAQIYVPQRIYYTPASQRLYQIDWIPNDGLQTYGTTEYEPTDIEHLSRRYIFAIRPFYLIQHGLKLDFDIELNTPGEWLQFELIGHYAGDHESDSYYYSPYNGWSNEIISGGDAFYSLRGIGGAVGYKHMFTRSGWYVSATATFNYFNVEYYGYKYVDWTQDGLDYIKREEGLTNKNFYKPEIRFNIGKHFALSRRLFIDAYIGFGYAHSYYANSEHYDYYSNYYGMYNDNAYAFGGRGGFFDAGFRIGWLFGN